MDDRFVGVVLDCSGSMGHYVPVLNAAFNAFKDEMRKSGKNFTIRTSKFGLDYHLDRMYQSAQIFEGESGLVSIGSGGSPLYDAMGLLLNSTNDPAGRGVPSMCLVITDGAEGGSRFYDYTTVEHIIAEKVANGWHFATMALGQGAIDQANRISKMVQKFGGDITAYKEKSDAYYWHDKRDAVQQKTVAYSAFLRQLIQNNLR